MATRKRRPRPQPKFLTELRAEFERRDREEKERRKERDRRYRERNRERIRKRDREYRQRISRINMVKRWKEEGQDVLGKALEYEKERGRNKRRKKLTRAQFTAWIYGML